MRGGGGGGEGKRTGGEEEEMRKKRVEEVREEIVTTCGIQVSSIATREGLTSDDPFLDTRVVERHQDSITLAVTHTVLPLRKEGGGGGDERVKILAAKRWLLMTSKTPLNITIFSVTTELVVCGFNWGQRCWVLIMLGHEMLFCSAILIASS